MANPDKATKLSRNKLTAVIAGLAIAAGGIVGVSLHEGSKNSHEVVETNYPTMTDSAPGQTSDNDRLSNDGGLLKPETPTQPTTPPENVGGETHP